MAGGEVNAKTPEERLEVITSILLTWESCSNMRLAQLIWNATGGVDIFNTEDTTLVTQFEEFRRRYGRKTYRP